MPVTPILSEAQWHDLRRRCVATGSTVAALLCAEHPYDSPLSIYRRAIGEEPERPAEDDAMMAAGQDAELMMPARVARLRPGLLLEKQNCFYTHPKLRLGATPDFFDNFDGCWQAKCVSPQVFKALWKGEPPLWILIQHQCEYLLTGKTSGGIICLVRDWSFSTYLHGVEPHEGTMRAIEKAVAEMEERVANRNPPPPDYRRDSGIIDEMRRHADKAKVVDLSGDNRMPQLCADYLHLKEREKFTKEQLDATRAEILDKINDAAKATCSVYSISASAVADSPDKVVTAADVGSITKGRRGYRRLSITQLGE